MASEATIPRFESRPPRGIQKVLARAVATKAGAWFFLNVANRADPFLMRRTNGRVMTAPGSPVLLLHHVGAKSGRERTTPLLYFTDGDDVVIVASNGGAPRHPAWLHNLRAHPEVRLSTDGRPEPYVAREAAGEERERLWRAACGMYPGFAVYQERAASRRIPVVVCSPKRRP